MTDREMEIAALAGHYSDADIGANLRISPRTVQNHISNGLRKTNTLTRQELFELVLQALGTQ
ncbi:response regulator transcription factor [Paenarthrobacter sp. RAF54_2]|uniref:response regulator transcription factor n=1 Tax=Paenarthrobacter sp. RAF54_2 TaxID=3233061 RepID=UPI003F9C5911